jgi:hypothetical protein
MSDQDVTFDLSEFEAGEVSGNVQLGRLEGYYEELFAEVIEDGIITADERARLDRMADSLGLDRARLQRLEQALQAAYERQHRVVIREELTAPPGSLAPGSVAPVEPATDVRTLALQRRIAALEARVHELEAALARAESQLSVEVDLSGVSGAASDIAPAEVDAADLERRVCHDPRDEMNVRALFRHYGRAGDLDRQWCAAAVLSHLQVASAEEAALFEKHRQVGLIRPRASLAREAWTRLLFHPEQEVLVGEIFAVVAPAVLMGRISALRRDKALPRLDPAKRQDATLSTIQAVRSFAWGAAILGMSAPHLYADPSYPGTVEMVPAVPPATRIGAQGLAGRSAPELAFLAGRHLAYFRAESFIRLLVPQLRDFEEIFLAALSVGNPGLPLRAEVRELVVPIAKAIEPILEPVAIDHLRGYFLRFVEEGGRANLQRWVTAVDRTAARSGLLLANDLEAARAMLALDGADTVADKMDDLLVFMLSERFAKLRRQIGIAVE